MVFSPLGGVESAMFSIVPIFVTLGFIFIFGSIIVTSIKGAKQWKKNNDSPILTVDATVVTKRSDVSRHHHTGNDNMHHGTSYTTYYATFQVESGDRMEFEISDSEYGMLVENDLGILKFQGTRYLGFNRKRN